MGPPKPTLTTACRFRGHLWCDSQRDHIARRWSQPSIFFGNMSVGVSRAAFGPVGAQRRVVTSEPPRG